MLAVFGSLLLAAAVQAGDLAGNLPAAEQTDDPCIQEDVCRTIDRLRFEGPDGTITEIDAGMTLPWVAQGNVLITPGESIIIQLVQDSGVLVPVLVSTGERADSAELADHQIRFSMSDVLGGQVRLIVESNYPGMVDYAALMVTIGKGPERTSVCTLLQGVSVFEQWQAPIYQMALWGFRESEDYGCKTIDLEAEPSQRESV